MMHFKKSCNVSAEIRESRGRGDGRDGEMHGLIKGCCTEKVTFKVDHHGSYYWQTALQAKV